MTKNDTLKLKGIALLMMIMAHVNTSLTTHVFYVGDYSLWDILAGGCHPVAFFLMLSGYGLRYVYEEGDKHHYNRLLKLLVHYWCIMLVFVTIGYFCVGSDVYPGSFGKVMENITTLHTSYNYECWFLFPFLVISYSYQLIFRTLDKMGGVIYILACIIYFGCGYVISHYHLIYKTAPYLIYNFIQVFFLLFSFLLGAMLKKNNFLGKIRNAIINHPQTIWLALPLIIIPILIGINIKTTAFGPFLAFFLFVGLYMVLERHQCKFLQLIGKHSMNIWMIHTFFLHYIFHDEIYSLHYTVLVYSATLTLSLLASYVINFITKHIDSLLYSRK